MSCRDPQCKTKLYTWWWPIKPKHVVIRHSYIVNEDTRRQHQSKLQADRQSILKASSTDKQDAAIYRVFRKELCNDIPNVTVWPVLRKRLHLKAYKLSIFHGIERWIVCTASRTNIFLALATQQHFEYNCKAIFETPCITSGSHIEPWLSQVIRGVSCYIVTVQTTIHVPWENSCFQICKSLFLNTLQYNVLTLPDTYF
jgi:hypothetical protein